MNVQINSFKYLFNVYYNWSFFGKSHLPLKKSILIACRSLYQSIRKAEK